MRTDCINIYKIARQSAGMTQEQAAEMLHVSVRSLADYEGNRTIPGDDIVCGMIETYETEWLGYEHLKQSTEVGKKYLPEINITDLAKSVLRLQKEVADVHKINTDMIMVACDGVVEEHEQETWEQVTKEVLEMVGAALAVVFSPKEKALCRGL
jgi:transcriptional regulator with XRE-family HTH domain